MEMTDRFSSFLKSLEADTYPEPPSPIHEEITAKVLPGVVAMCPAGARVLDVGCGQGVALKHFKELGCDAWGITTNAEDLGACKLAGFDCSFDDMHEQDDERGPYFDLIWARHVLEHSPAPLYALHVFKAILKPGGLLYIEVPMGDTSSHHENNPNHYSILSDSMWQSLIQKAGFQIIEANGWQFSTMLGPDEYRSYLCRK